MATRKVPSPNDGGESAPASAKRRRIIRSDLSSFESLNRDCLVLILSYLSSEEMNNVAECNRFCREARRHDSLDQTRTGTIVWAMPFFIDTVFYDMIAERGYNNVFQGNRTRLRMESYAMRNTETDCSVDQVQRAQLSRVTSLDISCRSPEDGHIDRTLMLFRLFQILPNLRELDASNLTINDENDSVRKEILRWCPNLISVTWKGSSAPLSGHYINFPEMLELNLDDSRFHVIGPPLEETTEGRDYDEEPTNGAGLNYIMLMDCQHLERLSIKRASYGTEELGFEPVTQGMLIKMVRHHATLRWLRSDLSKENVAMLKRERPEISFVYK